MRIGLLGGSFNPPHRAHLALARAALADGRVDRVLLMPAGLPPHKPGVPLTAAVHRLAMTRLLAEDRDGEGIEVSGRELRRDGPSFTIDTVRALRRDRPGTVWRLIVGWDMAISFATWREAAALADLAPPLIARRPPEESEAGGETGAAAVTATDLAALPAMLRAAAGEGLLAMPPMAVSSTHLRERLAAGAGDAELLEFLPPAVLAYIRRHGLYGSPVQDGGQFVEEGAG